LDASLARHLPHCQAARPQNMALRRDQAPKFHRNTASAAAQGRHHRDTRRPTIGDSTPHRRDQRTPMQARQQTIHALTSTEGHVPSHHPLGNLWCFAHNLSRGSHTQKAGDAKTPDSARPKTTHAQAPRDTRACPTHPNPEGGAHHATYEAGSV